MRTSVSTQTISISTGTILRTIAILVALGVLWLISDILLYCFVAVLLAGVIYPFAEWAERHHIPKIVAVLFIYLVLLGTIGLVITLLVPALIEQSKAFVGVYGDQLGNVASWVDSLKSVTQKYGLNLNFAAGLSSLQTQAQSIFGNLFSTVSTVFGGIAGFIVVLVLALYMVIEETAIVGVFHDWVPKKYQAISMRLVHLVIQKLGGWMRGQLLLCLIIGLLYLIAFLALGVPYPLLLAVLGGIFEFIPYIGPLLSAIPAVILAIAVSPLCALLTAVAIIIIQQLENNLIVPKIMQKTVGLNPIVSIIAFMIGAQLFNVIGAIFAIPVATALSLVWSEVRVWRQERTS